MEGFYLMIGQREIFIESTYKNKTQSLAAKIIQKLGGEDTPENRKWLLYNMDREICKVGQTSDGKKYYDISGKNWGGRGSWIDDGRTIIVKL